ncbi:MAG: tetratricopeptide repeat protein [Candidatus Sericytochromatia bacterium]|nr:tetratricopeptide repeat protein [Candidatus Sericytochromatia bacterium]
MNSKRDYPKLLTRCLVDAIAERDWELVLAEVQRALEVVSPLGERLSFWSEFLDELLRSHATWQDFETHWPGGSEGLEKPEYFLILGLQALSEESFERAGYFLARAAEVAPDSHVPLAYLGILHESLGCPSEALAYYDGALELKPGLFSVLNAAGNLCHELGFHRRAVSYYKEARPLLVEPVNQAVVVGNLGNSHRALGQMDAAIRSYTEALALDPSAHTTALALGECLLDSHRYQEAIACLEGQVHSPTFDSWSEEARGKAFATLARAHALDENPPAALACWWNHLGGKLADEPNEGVVALLKALYAWAITHPSDPLCELLLAAVNRRLGYLDSALLHAKRAAKDLPRHAAAFAELGAALLAYGREPVALEALDEAVSLAPERAVYRAMRATATWRNHPGLAEADLQEAIRLEPGDASLRCDLAWLRLSADEYDDAQEHFTHALFLREDAPILHGHHGPCSKRGSFSDLLDPLESELRHEDTASAHWMSGAAYAAIAGRYDLARQLLQGILADAPDNLDAIRNYAWLLTQNEHSVDATPWWARAVKLAPWDQVSRFFLFKGQATRPGESRRELIPTIREALEAEPHFHLARLLLARALDPDPEARLHLEYLVQALPGLYSPWFWLGKASFHRRDIKGARPPLEKSVQLNKAFLPARQMLVQCYTHLGDMARAHFHQAHCHLLSGHLHRAQDSFQRALELDGDLHEAEVGLHEIANRQQAQKRPSSQAAWDLMFGGPII